MAKRTLKEKYCELIESKLQGKKIQIRSGKYICYEVVFKNKENQDITKYIFLGNRGAIRMNVNTNSTSSISAPLWLTKKLETWANEID